MGAGTLYVVATPIGNLEDLSPRARRVLGESDQIACEDTRHTQKLLSAFGITTPRISLHQHNEDDRIPQLLARLNSGETIAVVSDAGTPLISDPGQRLVEACHDQRIAVVPVPGPSAPIAALSAAGLPAARFLFLGFPPRKVSKLRAFLQEFGGVNATRVLFLSPHRLVPTLECIAEEWGDQEAFLVREISKLYESGQRGSLTEIIRRASAEEPRGEYCLAVAGCSSKDTPLVDIPAYLHGLIALRGLTRSDAAKRVQSELGLPRREAYRLAGPGDAEGDPNKVLKQTSD